MTVFTRQGRFRTVLASLALVGLACPAAAQTIFRCPDGNYTNNAADAQAKSCKPMEGGNVPAEDAFVPPTRAQTQRLRETIKVGDYCSEGLVVEVKRPLVKVQSPRGGERWFRIDAISALGSFKTKKK
jgi:hypothetical protein